MRCLSTGGGVQLSKAFLHSSHVCQQKKVLLTSHARCQVIHTLSPPTHTHTRTHTLVPVLCVLRVRRMLTNQKQTFSSKTQYLPCATCSGLFEKTYFCHHVQFSFKTAISQQWSHLPAYFIRVKVNTRLEREYWWCEQVCAAHTIICICMEIHSINMLASG